MARSKTAPATVAAAVQQFIGHVEALLGVRLTGDDDPAPKRRRRRRMVRRPRGVALGFEPAPAHPPAKGRKRRKRRKTAKKADK